MFNVVDYHGIVAVAQVPDHRARQECEAAWRKKYPLNADGSHVCWDGETMHYTYALEGSDRVATRDAEYQIVRVDTTGKKIAEYNTGLPIEYATGVGKRTYRFDVLGDPLHAALYGAIREHNRNVQYWLELSAKNREGIDDADERQVSRETALLVGGRFEGSGQAIDAVLRAVGML